MMVITDFQSSPSRYKKAKPPGIRILDNPPWNSLDIQNNQIDIIMFEPGDLSPSK